MKRKYEPCARCREYCWDDSCWCVLFQVAIPWSDNVDDDDWQDLYAKEPEDAAEKFAEESDSGGDYTIIKNGNGEVWVRDIEGIVTKWNIEAEAVPTYRATQRTGADT